MALNIHVGHLFTVAIWNCWSRLNDLIHEWLCISRVIHFIVAPSQRHDKGIDRLLEEIPSSKAIEYHHDIFPKGELVFNSNLTSFDNILWHEHKLENE